MDTNVSMLIVVAVVVVAIIAIAYVFLQKQRSQNLRSKFGPEYDRLVEEEGGKRQAEAALQNRAKRVEQLNIHPLTHAECARFAQAWREEQARFVDDPHEAVAKANQLVKEVMQARGYPVANFEQRAEDISVDHPMLVRNYRAAHEIALRDQQGEADTEDLRTAMVYYRELFIDLLEERTTQSVGVRR